MIDSLNIEAALAEVDQYTLSLVSQEFDGQYYLAAYPDVKASGIPPLLHFVTTGWREGRNPSKDFDVSYYLATNTDVADAGINPFIHYVLAGRSEGRQCRRPLDVWRRQLEQARPVDERCADWKVTADNSDEIDIDAIVKGLAIGADTAGVVVSLSHDDYGANFGGIQNVIGDEQRTFAAADWKYLHLSPAQPLPMLADATNPDSFRFKVRIGGTLAGVVTALTLNAALATKIVRSVKREVVIHHLMGHAPEIVTSLVRAIAVCRPKVWLHDFFTLCPSYALMRNDVKFCFAPPVDSGGCNVCSYGRVRNRHVERMAKFFADLVPDVAAPSQSALDFWRSHCAYPAASSSVIAPGRLLLTPSVEGRTFGNRKDSKLTVAHVGARVFLKGWPVFEELALRFQHDPRYRFLQLGASEGVPSPSCITNVPVKVDASNREAMIEAIAEHNVDIVVSWSLWSETFCFAVHEALAGGAFVVARADAGNVWPAVSSHAPTQGLALENADALHALFEGDALQSLRSRTRFRGTVMQGENSLDWILARNITDVDASARTDSQEIGHV